MTAANNIINILQPYLKKIESAYKRVLYFDDIDYQKNGYAVGKGCLIISVKKGDASLAIQVIEEMSLENIEDYLTDRSLPGTWKGFSHKIPKEIQEILEKLCTILLKTPADSIDPKAVKQKVMDAEFACHRKYHPISEQAMQSMRFEAERAELNTSLKKG